jgi:non-specific serine/threonine protein kinase/serine/threonine-protein kinase
VGNGEPEDLTHTVEIRYAEPGAVIGSYRLIRQLGEGGMGVVYHAQQFQPIRRDVALKIVKPGMDSKQVIARFESERQALALMEHPNIARVLDAGATETGLPYFVMELVDGVPITRHADDHKLTLNERLQLFIPVCEAIQHAHQKGIIHRDIKPSNILVAEQDGRPVPKVIDFGIAKAMGQQLNADAPFTQIGTVVGTLEYMSPEQADVMAHDIDTRADIYSLGAVLYELLTGARPLDREELAKFTYLELLQRIREFEPPRPSKRASLTASTDVATITAISAQRKTDPGRLPKLLHGELDWIVMKALEKDRQRRYETANGMLRDIQRFLSGEAVEAGPPSQLYRLSKMAWKHRHWLAAAGAFAVLLVVGMATTTWLAVRSNRAERRADEEAATAKAVNAFLENDLLAQASANQQPDPDVKVRTVLDRAARGLSGKFAAQPRIAASLRRTVGKTYGELGLYAEASRQVERAIEIDTREFGPSGRETLAARTQLSLLDYFQGHFPEAEARLREVLALQQKQFGANDPDVMDSMDSLATTYLGEGKFDDAEKLFQSVIALRMTAAGPDSPELLKSQGNLADVYENQGRYQLAQELNAKVAAADSRVFGSENPETMAAQSNLAGTYVQLGKYDQAEAIYLKLLETKQRVLGPEHPDTLTAINNVSFANMYQGKYQEAVDRNRMLLELRRKVQGPDHPETLTTEHNLATGYHTLGKDADALPLETDVVERRKRVLGAEHLLTLMSMDQQASEYAGLGQNAQAEALWGQVIDVQGRVLGPRHPERLKAMSRLGGLLRREGKYEQAEAMQTESLEGLRQAVGPGHPNTLTAQVNLALTKHYLREDAKAEELLRAALPVMQAKFADNWQRYRCESILGAVLAGQGKKAEAGALLASGYQGMLERKKTIPADSLYSLDDAAKWKRELK